MRANVKSVAAVIALTLVLFWALATGVDVARRDPEALEAPLAYLAITWLLYLPVFCVAGLGVIAAGASFALALELRRGSEPSEVPFSLYWA
ncbi:MAG TPA: hypothetical protein VGY48_25690 [Vicinamibacterales bacterium]|jgi:hypothetical protein|nr:hypothetical protein [Vicinamibacterales bacterium]